jgi:hypothetical protein
MTNVLAPYISIQGARKRPKYMWLRRMSFDID